MSRRIALASSPLVTLGIVLKVPGAAWCLPLPPTFFRTPPTPNERGGRRFAEKGGGGRGGGAGVKELDVGGPACATFPVDTEPFRREMETACDGKRVWGRV